MRNKMGNKMRKVKKPSMGASRTGMSTLQLMKGMKTKKMKKVMPGKKTTKKSYARKKM